MYQPRPLAACILLLFFLSVFCSHAQDVDIRYNLNGEWGELDEEGKINVFKLEEDILGLKYFKISGDTLYQAIYDKKNNKYNTLKNYRETTDFGEGMKAEFVTLSIQNRNNAIYSWINTCETCNWTETQIYHFSLVSENDLIVHHYRIVNNKDLDESGGKDCFEEGGKCLTQERTYKYRRYQR